MKELRYSPPTKRRRMTKARATRIFVSRDGICFICRTHIIIARDEWFVEHPETIEGGGSDDDDDLWPAHVRCKPEKDAIDAGRKAKRDRLICKGWRDKPKRGGFRGWRDFQGNVIWRDQ